MSNTIFEQIVDGKPIPLTELQLGQFEVFCSSQNLTLDKLNDISLILFEQKRQYGLHFLQYLQKNEISKPAFNDFIHQDNKVRIYNNLFAIYLTKATKEHSKIDIDRLVSQAKKYLTQGENVRMTPIVINRAFLEYFDGQLTKSTNSFNKSIQISEANKDASSNENKMIGLLGLAQISFLKRNYAKALEFYKKVLSTFKTLPIKARIGMAYSFFYLQKYQMARACFNRILQIDPTCVEAYIGLGIIEQKNQNFPEYFKFISKAFKVNRKHPLVLIHLSEHFLIKGELQKATRFAEQGLVQAQGMTKFFIKANSPSEDIQSVRNDYLQLKARFNNILGQIQHIKNNFVQALKYYRLASNQGLVFNQIYLSQIYTHPMCQNYIEGLQILQKLFKECKRNQVKMLNESIKNLAYLKSKNSIIPKNGEDVKTSEEWYNEAIAYNKNDIQVKIQLSNQIIQTKKARTLRLLLSSYRILEAESISLVKPQLLNNIAVLHLQNHEYPEATQFQTKCVQKLKQINEKLSNGQSNGHNSLNSEYDNQINSEQTQEEYQIKINANYLISLFNLAVIKQRQSQFSQAIRIYQQIIQINKFFIDAHIRMAHVYFLQGNFKAAMDTLQTAMGQTQNTQAKFIRFDKVLSIKAAILKQWGDQSAAKQVLKQVSKVAKDIYTQIYDLSIHYESLMRRQVQITHLKQFLRPNRQIYMKYCHDDPNSAFGYLVLCVLLLTDKRISLKQGTQLFSQLKQHCSEELPIVLYNMGLFFLNYDDYEKAKFIFKSYKQKICDQRGEQMLGLTNFLQGQHKNTIRSVKRNILLNPTSLKSRYQLIYTNEKKCQQQRGDDKSKLRLHLSTHLQILKKCHKFYNYFSKLNINDYVKNYESPDIKQQTRNYGQKIRAISEEHKFYVSSQIDYYEKFQKDENLRIKEEEERKLKNRVIDNDDKENNFNQMMQGQNVFEESDSEEIRKRKKDEKKKKALELAKKKQQEVNEKWIDLKIKQREENQKKGSRTARQPREKGTKKRQKRPKAETSSQGQVSYDQQRSEQRSYDDSPRRSSPSQASFERQNADVEAPKRKRRQERRQERREQLRSKKKKIKKQRLARLSDNDEQFSANPFQDSQYAKNGQQSERSEGKKKRKLNKPQQDDDIDLDKFMVT